jgi:KaiC/GvpD/RAD55 family RecA-like ATPase
MVRSELVKRSPLRILEQSTHGGVGPGHIGVLASRKGVGKTACLVHIATDKLFQGMHVIHVSFSSRIDHIISWYEDLFKEIARKRELESAMQVHDEVIKNRVIMNFNQEGVTIDQIMRSIRSMIVDGNFNADTIVVDGFDFRRTDAESLEKLKAFGKDLGLGMWFTATLSTDEGIGEDLGVPKELAPVIDEITILITLRPREKHIHLELAKDHDRYPEEDLHLMLDPKTLLIAEE